MFHRIEEMDRMSGPRFCVLAPLLGAYPGALAASLAAESRDASQSPAASSPTASASATGVAQEPVSQGARPVMFSRATSGPDSEAPNA